MAAGSYSGKPLSFRLGMIFSENRYPLFRIMLRLIPPNYGLFRGLFRSAHALSQDSDQIGNRGDGFSSRPSLGVEATVQGVDQRGTDHGSISAFGNRPRRFRRADAKADANRQFGMPL